MKNVEFFSGSLLRSRVVLQWKLDPVVGGCFSTGASVVGLFLWVGLNQAANRLSRGLGSQMP